MDARGLLHTLAKTAAGEVRADPATRELYATDASLYRRLPVAALRAASRDDLEAAVAACREHGVPLTMRGAGTSLAGQTVGPGLIVDCSALRAAVIDPDARLAHVEPGVVLDQLNGAASAHGLVFGPDVATANRATLGGMIANNSAGARSIAYGMTDGSVVALDVVFADGSTATLRRGGPGPPLLEGVRHLGAAGEAPRLLRRVSGYNLEALRGDDPDWTRLLCGSEGTLAVTTRATLALRPRPEARGLAVLRFPTIDAALEAVPRLLPTTPSAVELLDREMVDPRNRAAATAQLTAFAGDAVAMLVVEYQGSGDEVRERLDAHPGALILTDQAAQEGVWQVRRSGIARAMGLTTGDAKPLAFIEDPAVPPERLALFARGVRAVLDREELPAIWYGHASVGCLHIRPMLDLRADGAVARMRRIAEAVADLVVEHGGSLSGEHGDGRLRGELLPRMYPESTIRAFADLKRAVDPEGLLNPGVIVDPEPLDTNLRLLTAPPLKAHRTSLDFSPEGGLARAAEACTNNGACRKDVGTMCPSYQALGDERHSTRGRAVLFRAALEGRMEGGLANDGLHEALDLCLGCKACKSECPAQVDMARLKIEALAHRHRERGVPWRARLWGHAHELLKLGSRAPALASLGTATLRPLIGHRVPSPVREWRPQPSRTDGRDVVLLADTFTRFLHPEIGDAAVRVLEACGARVTIVDPGCCGRPFLSQGLVSAARQRVRGTLDALTPYGAAGTPIVVLEPSCWSMLVDDAPALVRDARASIVAAASVTFEQAIAELDPPPAGVRHFGAAAELTHCHVRALSRSGSETRRRLFGPDVEEIEAGCCGMAGSFGYSHPDVSARLGERLRAAIDPNAIVVTSGTSCRAQVRKHTEARPMHPAEFLALSLDP